MFVGNYRLLASLVPDPDLFARLSDLYKAAQGEKHVGAQGNATLFVATLPCCRL